MKSGKLESVKPRSRHAFILLDDMYVLLTISGKCKAHNMYLLFNISGKRSLTLCDPQQAIDPSGLEAHLLGPVLSYTILSTVLPARLET
jgi:hypothetical protein